MIKKLWGWLFGKKTKFKSGDFIICVSQNKTGHIINYYSDNGFEVLFCGDNSLSYYFSDNSLRKILSVSESAVIYEE